LEFFVRKEVIHKRRLAAFEWKGPNPSPLDVFLRSFFLLIYKLFEPPPKDSPKVDPLGKKKLLDSFSESIAITTTKKAHFVTCLMKMDQNKSVLIPQQTLNKYRKSIKMEIELI
jgi:hypothetical protein